VKTEDCGNDGDEIFGTPRIRGMRRALLEKERVEEAEVCPRLVF